MFSSESQLYRRSKIIIKQTILMVQRNRSNSCNQSSFQIIKNTMDTLAPNIPAPSNHSHCIPEWTKKAKSTTTYQSIHMRPPSITIFKLAALHRTAHTIKPPAARAFVHRRTAAPAQISIESGAMCSLCRKEARAGPQSHVVPQKRGKTNSPRCKRL